MKRVFNFFFSIFLFLFCGLYFINLAPDNPLITKNIFQQMAPQGFAFYSKSPRDEQFLIYSDNDDIYLPNFRKDNFGGWKRKGRAQAIEIGRLDSMIPNDYWLDCTSESDCIKVRKSNKLKSFNVKKDQKLKNINKGVYYIVRSEPLSFSFLKYKKTSTTENKIAKVKIV